MPPESRSNIVRLLRLLVLLVQLLQLANSHRILVFSPMISRSHMISNGRIADELAKAGHYVVLFAPEFDRKANINATKLAKQVTVTGFSDVYERAVHSFSDGAFNKNGWIAHIKGLFAYQDTWEVACRELTEMTTVLNELRKQTFDLAITEQLNLCPLAIVHQLGIRSHIWLSSCAVPDYMSNLLAIPTPLGYVPPGADTDGDHRPSYIKRIDYLIAYGISVVVNRYGSMRINRLMREKYGDDFPDVDRVAADSPLIFVSSDEMIDFPRPSLHNVVYIGGLGLTDPKPLKKDFSDIIAKGQDGAVLVSFGSIVSTKNIPAQVKTNLLTAFRRLNNVHFIIKIDKDDEEMKAMAKDVNNVDVIAWLAQHDLLGDPRLLAFLTHGGVNSVLEAAFLAVPIIVVPFFGDQLRNGRAVERNGWGISLSRFDLDSDTVAHTLRAVIDNPSYRENARRISHLMRTKPFNAADRLVRYTTFLLENDGRLPELQNDGRHLSAITYFNLDIIVPFVFLFSVFCVFVARSVFACLAQCWRRKNIILTAKKVQ